MEFQAYEVSAAIFSQNPISMYGADGERSDLERFYFVSGAFDAPSVPVWVATLTRPHSEINVCAVKQKPKSVVKVSPKTKASSKNLVMESFVSKRLEYIYFNDAAARVDDSQSRAALRGVVDTIEDLSDAADFVALDTFLAGVDPARYRPITNVAFLRASYHAKDKLVNWDVLYRGVYAYLESIGKDPGRALRGLSSSQISRFA